MPDAPAYKRILLKLSGEALMGERRFGIEPDVVARLADEIRDVHRLGVEMAVVIGGGNIIRGVSAAAQGIDRVAGDHMGLLATVINGLALQDSLEKRDVRTRLMSAVEMRQIAEPFIRRRAIRHLEKGRVVLFVGGTGNPFFTTDSAAALRANEIKADVLLKATKVDGVYDANPDVEATARFLKTVSYRDALRAGLQVMDAAAIALCMENGIPIKVFNLRVRGNIERVVRGEDIGSLVSSEACFKTLRTGRANLAILDGIRVTAYGAEVPLNQVSNLSVPDPTLIVAQPWDPKMAPEIERAIRRSDLGLNPQSDGKVVRIPIPQLTEDRRKELAKKAHQMAEEARVEIRRYRHEGNDRLKKLFKDKTISEDDERRGLEESQKLTDKKTSEVDELLKTKEKEILAV